VHEINAVQLTAIVASHLVLVFVAMLGFYAFPGSSTEGAR
jgi:hypothetical protein